MGKISVIWCRLNFIEGIRSFLCMEFFNGENITFYISSLSYKKMHQIWVYFLKMIYSKITARSGAVMSFSEVEVFEQGRFLSFGRRLPQEHHQANDVPGVHWLILLHWEQVNWYLHIMLIFTDVQLNVVKNLIIPPIIKADHNSRCRESSAGGRANQTKTRTNVQKGISKFLKMQRKKLNLCFLSFFKLAKK